MNGHLFSRKIVGDYAVYDNSLLFRAGTFNDRIVNGKPLTVTKDNVADMVRKFTGPIPGNLLHTSYLKGRAGHILDLRQRDDELRGTIAIPLWLDEHLGDDERKLSVELDPSTFDTVKGFALCCNPAVTDAQLMSAESEFAKKRHDTYAGQDAMQTIHDHAARSGAICSPPSNMVSKHEASAIQAIHDTAVEHGASCSMSSYYTNTENNLTREEFLAAFKALFIPPTETPSSEEVAKPADGATPVTDPSGVVHQVVEVPDVTKTEEFIAKEQEVADLKAKLDAIEAEKVKSAEEAQAKFTAANEKAIDALISGGKFDPKDRDDLLAKRAKGPELFDEMAGMLPVKPEFAESPATITAEQARDSMDPNKIDRVKRLEADKTHLARLGGL